MLRRSRRAVLRNADAVAGFVLFLVAEYGAYPASFTGQPVEWRGWYDQLEYFLSARGFLQGDLSPGLHWYPLLYPLLLTPFALLPDFYAALLPDALCFAVALLGFRLVAGSLGVSRPVAFGLFMFTTLLCRGMDHEWMVPWTTTLSAALIWLAMGLICRALGPDWPARPRVYFGIGVLLGLIPLCRPGDVCVSAVLFLALALALGGDPARRRHLGRVVAGGGMALCAYLLLYLPIYGPHICGYALQSAAFGEDFARLGWKTYIIFIDPAPWYPQGKALLHVLPLLPLGAAGLLCGLLVGKRERGRLAMLGLAALVYLAFMLAYVDLLPSGLWRYNNVHYFKWVVPLFGLFAWLWLKALPGHPRTALATLALVLLPLCIHLVPVPAAPGTPARLVLFPGSAPDFTDIYFSRALLVDRRGPQLDLAQVHLVPGDHDLVYAEALKRPFAGDEVWDWPAHAAYALPPMKYVGQDTIVPGPFPRRAVARYGVELGFGWPCWLRETSCPMTLPPMR